MKDEDRTRDEGHRIREQLAPSDIAVLERRLAV